jgi:ABC-type Fe3+-hydroxamate transport system substrate-binding protein
MQRSHKVFWIFGLLLAASYAFAARTIQDEAGRTVTLPDRVTRVISLMPSVTDTIYSLGASAQLVGITDFSQYPPQAAREKPSVGDILKPSLERIAALHPDLAIGVSTFNSPDTVRGLERIGIPVYLVNGRGIAGLYSSVTNIGRALGRDHEAALLVQKMKAREERIRAEARTGKHPRVLLVVQLDPCITAGRGAFITELIEAAGAISVTDDLAQDWLRVSVESIMARKPDYIMLMKSAPLELKDLRAKPGWNSMDAVKAGRVIRVDERLQVPSPVAFDALEELARQIKAVQ